MNQQYQWKRHLAGFLLIITALATGCGGGGGSSSSGAGKNATLSDLTLSAGDLDQAFQSSLLDYTATVNFLTASTTVTPTTADADATVTVNGAAVASGSASESIPLDVGDTLITVIVTAGNSTSTETYTVSISRESANEFAQQAYIKASNTGQSDRFGFSVALSGNTLAVGAPGEKSSATGIDGNQDNNSLTDAGAVYVFTRNNSQWSQQAYLKASNTGNDDRFGSSIALFNNTLAVGAPGEKSSATGIDGNQDNNSLTDAGAVYVFTRNNSQWGQQAYLKASNTDNDDRFGSSIALFDSTLAVGAPGEDSNAAGIDGNQDNNSLSDSGAVYVFTRNDSQWSQQAYVKASNTGNEDRFGSSIALFNSTLAVGAPGEDSNASGINGNQGNNSLNDAGAGYLFTRNNSQWSQQAYVKASNTGNNDRFGSSIALFDSSLAVGAPGEDSNTTGIDADQGNNSLTDAGAVYVFTRNNSQWSQQAYIKASNTGDSDLFGTSVALCDDTLAVGATGEDSQATGINGNQGDNSLTDTGAVYAFSRSGNQWSQQAYVKASNTGNDDRFGTSVTLCGDTLSVGATGEDSNATGVDAGQADNSLIDAGAVYVFQ
jgi:predicted porin